MKKLSLLRIVNENFLDSDFVTLRDIIDHGYSRKVLRVLRHIKDLEDRGELERYGIKNSKCLAHGAQGAIFDSIEKGFVVKASFDHHDMDSARGHLKHNNPHMAQIKSIKIIPIGEEGTSPETKDKNLALIQMEKLKPFEEETNKFFQSLLQPLIDELNKEAKSMENTYQQKLSKKLHKKIREFYSQNKIRLSGKEKRMCRQMLRFLKKIHNDGYHFGDRQTSQFLSDRRGRLKLVDFGSIRKNL